MWTRAGGFSKRLGGYRIITHILFKQVCNEELGECSQLSEFGEPCFEDGDCQVRLITCLIAAVSFLVPYSARQAGVSCSPSLHKCGVQDAVCWLT